MSRKYKFLITAGPTREFIDPFRFISNPSSGKMGYALARAAVKRGQGAVLISGPVEIAPPSGVTLVRVVSALEMQRAVEKRFPAADVLIMAAAVADYRPSRRMKRKMKKSRREISLPLVRNPDILKKVAARKGKRIVVGFSAETENVVDNARQKMKMKHLDLVVANDLTDRRGGFASDRNRVTVIGRAGRPEKWPLLSKDEVADRLIARVMGMIDETS